MDGFTIETEEKGNTLILRMQGAINSGTLPTYREKVDALMSELDVANRDNLNFVCDYSKVTDVDSATVGSILERLNNAVREDHKVVFVNVPDRFKHLVEVLNVSETIVIYDTEEEALKNLK